MLIRTRKTVLLFALLGTAAVWGQSPAGAPPLQEGQSHGPAATLIEQPVTLDVVQTAQSNVRRMMLQVFKLGHQDINRYLLLDTGSSGIAINASAVLPRTMYSSSGIAISGDRLDYNGITFTRQQATQSYGGPDGVSTTMNGVIAWASVTFGDNKTQITSHRIPIFVYYSIARNGQQIPAGLNIGIFGINPSGLQLNGALVPVTPYLQYAPGVRRGFIVHAAGNNWKNCDYTVANACPASPLLTFGLNDSNTLGYSTVPMVSNSKPYAWQAYLNSSFTDSSGRTQSSKTMMDTGTAYLGGVVPQMDASQPIRFNAGSGFAWEFTVPPRLQNNFGGAKRSILGLPFFFTNSLFMDFDQGLAGVKGSY